MRISQVRSEKTHTISFNFESCGMLQNISCKYYILWILYLSTFLSIKCKSTSASTKDMHGRLKAVTYQIRFFFVSLFCFSKIFSCQMLLLFLAWYWIDYKAEELQAKFIFVVDIFLNLSYTSIIFQSTPAIGDKYHSSKIKNSAEGETLFMYYVAIFWRNVSHPKLYIHLGWDLLEWFKASQFIFFLVSGLPPCS